MTTTHDFKGRLFIVTGSARGLGFAMAQRLVNSNARMALTDINEDALLSAASELGDAAYARVGDVSDTATIPALVKEIEENVGPTFAPVLSPGHRYVDLQPGQTKCRREATQRTATKNLAIRNTSGEVCPVCCDDPLIPHRKPDLRQQFKK